LTDEHLVDWSRRQGIIGLLLQRFHYRRQKPGRRGVRTVKISNRPTIIRKERIHLLKEEMAENTEQPQDAQEEWDGLML